MAKKINPTKTVLLGGSFAVEIVRLKKGKAKITLVGADCNCKYATAKIHVCEDCIRHLLNVIVSRLYHEGFEIIDDRGEMVIRHADAIVADVLAACNG